MLGKNPLKSEQKKRDNELTVDSDSDSDENLEIINFKIPDNHQEEEKKEEIPDRKHVQQIEERKDGLMTPEAFKQFFQQERA